MCVCVCFWPKGHMRLLNLCFLCFDNLMQDFFQKKLNYNIVFDTYAWKLSRVNNVPNKASHLQPIDYFWELQPIIYHDLTFVNLDIESKAGQYPEPKFLMEVLGT